MRKKEDGVYLLPLFSPQVSLCLYPVKLVARAKHTPLSPCLQSYCSCCFYLVLLSLESKVLEARCVAKRPDKIYK